MNSEKDANVVVRALTSIYKWDSKWNRWVMSALILLSVVYGWLVFSSAFGTSKDKGRYLIVSQRAFAAAHTYRPYKDYAISSVKGCNPFLLEHCVSIGYDEAILNDPGVLERLADSMVRPCKYLTSPDAPVPPDRWSHEDRQARVADFAAWYGFGCDTNQPDTTKINTVLFNKQREAILYIVKP